LNGSLETKQNTTKEITNFNEKNEMEKKLSNIACLKENMERP
jgi:hypothetical protein